MNKSKIFMIISICVLCISIIGSSIAYYRKEVFTTTATTITHGLDYYINYKKGNDITAATLTPTTVYTNGPSADIELWKIDNTYDIYGHIYLDIDTMSDALSDSGAIKYTVTNNDTVIAEGTVEKNTKNTVLIKSNIELQTTKQLYTVYIWLDNAMNINSSLTSEPLSLSVRCEATMKPMNNNAIEFISELYENADKSSVSNNSINYTYAPSVSLMNDGFSHGTQDMWEKMNFPFTDTAGCLEYLSDDNLKNLGLCNDADSCAQVISSTLQNLALPSVEAACESSVMNGNIRYYGANPNNYIDIGNEFISTYNNWEATFKKMNVSESMIPTTSAQCKEFVECENLYANNLFNSVTACEENFDSMLLQYGFLSVDELCTSIPAGTKILYRIIGLFKDVELPDGTKKDLIKVVNSNPSIGNYAYDLKYDASTQTFIGAENDWSQATLQSILNDGYYNSTSGTHTFLPHETTGDIIPTKIEDYSKYGLSPVNNKIIAAKWNLGASNNFTGYSNTLYMDERGTEKCTNCTYDTIWEGNIALPYPSDIGYAADFNSCSSTFDTYNSCNSVNWMSNINEWLLTPSLHSDSTTVWRNNNGLITGHEDGSYTFIVYANSVRPTFYLKPELSIISGSGTDIDPYIIDY